MLVFLVVYVFLQSWHPTLIAAITIPVSLIGTFALMIVLGFSINTLSLLGLVLAIGLVVDDAIVVVENVQRQLEEGVKDTREAARLAMREVTSPIIATTLVLMAVFVPVAFMPGIVGQLYNQFALTIACSVGLSAVNSLSLSPALCGVLLSPKHVAAAGAEKIGWWQGIKQSKWFAWLDWAKWFNAAFDWLTRRYERAVRRCVAWWPAVLVSFAILIGCTLLLFKTVPGGFLPEEDQGYVVALIQTPPGTAIGQTEKVTEQLLKLGLEIPGMADSVSIPGYNLVDNAKQSAAATVFFVLKPWTSGKAPSSRPKPIIEKLHEKANEPSATPG